ncbi:MAG: hypothetical protein ACHQVK_04760 [Candidatus Paceibacterales bacterium]
MFSIFQTLWTNLRAKFARQPKRRYKTTTKFDNFYKEERQLEEDAKKLGNQLRPKTEDELLAKFMRKYGESPFPEDAATTRAKVWCKQHGFTDPFPIHYAPKA